MRFATTSALGLLAVTLLVSPVHAGDNTSSEQLMQELLSSKDRNQQRALLKALKARGRKASSVVLGAWKQARTNQVGADLVELSALLDTEAAAADLVEASRSKRAAIQASAAEYLANYPKVALKPLLRLLRMSHSPLVTGSALNSLAALSPAEAWEPLLAMARVDLDSGHVSFPRRSFTSALQEVYAKNASARRLKELLQVCSELSNESAELLFGVLACGEKTVTPPFLRALLAEYVETRGKGLDPLASLPEEMDPLLDADSFAATLRPFSSAMAVTACRGLAAARDQASASVLIAATRADDAKLRRSSVSVLHLVLPKRDSKKPEDVKLRDEATTAVIDRLVDQDRYLRKRAHVWLKRETKQTFPLGFKAWSDWHKAEIKKRAGDPEEDEAEDEEEDDE